MAVEFNRSFTNNGLLTSASYFSSQTGASKDELANSIITKLGGNEETGFDFKSVVDLTVAQKMGSTIEELQSSITNTNIRVNTVNNLADRFQQFQSEIIAPFSQESSLSGLTPQTSDSSSVDVAISSASTASSGGNFSMKVEQMAEAESLSSQTFASEDTVLGSGVISIDLGSYATGSFESNGAGDGVTLSIEEGMTLKDLANEINNQSSGLSAQIINDANGARLAIFSNRTGADNAVNISVSATNDPRNDALNALAYSRQDPGTMTLGNAAQDAAYTLNGVSFTSASNQLTDVFGIDITLKQATNSEFNISTTSNNAGVSTNVEAFVYSYNELLAEYNAYRQEFPEDDGIGSLYGEAIADDIERELTSLQDTIRDNASSFSDLGITFDGDMSLALDPAQLNAQLNADPNAVRNAFSDTLTSSNAELTILDYGNDPNNTLVGYTQDGTYSVEVTQAAERASYTGTATGTVTVGAGGQVIEMNVNGRHHTFTLGEGTYSSTELASWLSQKINGVTASGYRVTDNGGALQIESEKYGSSQNFEVISGGAVLGLDGATATGQDIQGRINGAVASGEGTTLTSILTNDAKGLSVDVGSNQVGNVGTVTLQRGALTLFDDAVSRIAGSEGLLSAASEEYLKQLDESNRDSYVMKLEEAHNREESLRARYNAQYSAHQSAISAMQNNLDLINTLFAEESDN